MIAIISSPVRTRRGKSARATRATRRQCSATIKSVCITNKSNCSTRPGPSTHLGYLEALLQAKLEEREQRLIERRIREARLPRMKTLEEFDFTRNPKVSAQQIHELAQGDYIAKASSS